MRVGATEDVSPSSRHLASSRRRRSSSSSAGGPRRRPRDLGLGARSARRTRRSSRELDNLAGAARLAGVAVYLGVSNFGQPDDAADARGAGAVRRLRSGDREAIPRAARRHRRQRAEPEPLLAPAVQPRRQQRGRAGVPRAAGADLRRDQDRAPRSRDRRRPVAARERQTGRHPTDALADEVPARPRHRLPRERADAADHGRARVPPLRRQLEPAADAFAHPRTTSIGVADYGKLVGAARRGVRRDGAAGLDAADPLRRVRRRDADPARRRRSTTAPSRPTTRPTTRRRRALLPARRSRSRSASRASRGSSSSTPSTRRRSPRGSPASSTRTDAEGEPRGGARRGAPLAPRRDRAVPGPAADAARETLRWPAASTLRKHRAATSFTRHIDCRYEALLDRAGRLVTSRSARPSAASGSPCRCARTSRAASTRWA